MKFFIDESGDFNTPKTLITHKACVTVCIVISDLIHLELQRTFEEFCSRLSSLEYENGEPKGYKLSRIHKAEFCDFLTKFQGLLVIPATIDISLIAMLESEKQIQDRMSEHIRSLIPEMIHETMREDLRLLANQFKNLSQQQSIRVFSYVQSISESLRYALIYLSTNGHEKSWKELSFEIDRANPQPNSREEIVFSKMIGEWISAWSKSKPFTLIKEVHTQTHPFISNFATPEGIDGNKIIEGNIVWTNSRDSWGIRMADFASNIVYNAVNDLDDRNGSASLFTSLMRSSPYNYLDGPGLISPFKNVPEETLEIFRLKYRPISEIMRKNYTNSRFIKFINEKANPNK